MINSVNRARVPGTLEEKKGGIVRNASLGTMIFIFTFALPVSAEADWLRGARIATPWDSTVLNLPLFSHTEADWAVTQEMTL